MGMNHEVAWRWMVDGGCRRWAATGMILPLTHVCLPSPRLIGSRNSKQPKSPRGTRNGLVSSASQGLQGVGLLHKYKVPGWTMDNGNGAALRAFQSEVPNLTEVVGNLGCRVAATRFENLYGQASQPPSQPRRTAPHHSTAHH